MSYLGRSAKLSLKAQEKVSFLATAGQTVKTGLSYVPSFVEVYVNGVLLTDTTDFTATNGNSVTFTVALLLNDEVTVISLKTFSVADHYSKTEADTLLAAKSPLASPVFTGSVGIGTSGPAQKLHVKDGNIQVENTTGSGILKFLNSGNAYIDNKTIGSNTYIRVSDSSDTDTTAITCLSSGNVGINTATPRALLDLGAGSGDGSLSNTTSQYQVVLAAPQGTGDYGRNIGWVEANSNIVAAINAVDNGTSSSTGLTFSTGNSSAIAEAMRIDSAGIVTKPLQPAFDVYHNGSSYNSGTTTASLNLNAARHNIGNHYSLSNRRFVAPVAGLYQFNFRTIVNGAASNAHLRMLKNGSQLQGGDSHYSAGATAWNNWSYSLTTLLSANDYIEISTISSQAIHGLSYQSFNGYLIG